MQLLIPIINRTGFEDLKEDNEGKLTGWAYGPTDSSASLSLSPVGGSFRVLVGFPTAQQVCFFSKSTLSMIYLNFTKSHTVEGRWAESLTELTYQNERVEREVTLDSGYVCYAN